MESVTTIGHGVAAADLGAQYDAACKRLLSEKAILARIMKECLEEFQDIPVTDIENKYIEGTPEIGETPVLPDDATPRIQGAANEDAAIREGTITYDIRFRAIAPKDGGYIQLIINIEAQNDYYPGYPLIKRGMYYCSRMISSQYGVDFPPEQYKGVKKVYSIWICMNPPKSRENTINRYHMTEEHLVGEAREVRENYDLLTVLMVCLGDSDCTQGLLRMLDVLLSSRMAPAAKTDVLEKEFEIPISRSFETEVSGMCNLSKGVWQDGEREGIEKGKIEGKIETKLQDIKLLMDTLKLTMEQAMDALRIPDGDRKEYEELLSDES